VRNLPALLSNATQLVTRFFAKMSKKRRRCAVVNLGNNVFFIAAKFTDVYGSYVISNNYPTRISGKMGFTIEDKALIIIN
jgi:hypothetical protein